MYKPLPIGVDNFKDVIVNDYYYVDKTLWIKELLDLKGTANLFARPRRFGKTLNLSMLRYFFEDTGDAVRNEVQIANQNGRFAICRQPTGPTPPRIEHKFKKKSMHWRKKSTESIPWNGEKKILQLTKSDSCSNHCKVKWLRRSR